MPEGARAIASPPDLAANEQMAAASDFDTERMRNLKAANQPMDLLKGDLPSDITDVHQTPKSPRQMTEQSAAEQRNIAASLASSNQQISEIRKAESKISNDKGGVSARSVNKLFSGPIGTTLQKIPGLGASFTKYKSAKNPQTKIKILKRIKKRLSLVKRGASIAYGLSLWGEAFAATLVTIIIPILLILALLPWIIICYVFEIGPLAKAIGKALKLINQAIKPLERKFQNDQQRQIMLAKLREAELEAANEAMATSRAA